VYQYQALSGRQTFMKKNSPTTHHEYSFAENEILYSRTTPKGVILEVNDNFVSISGFSREELIGQAHNIVRHPDVPQEAFADLWKDLKQGRTWRSVLKNWRKDGGFYWVDANVSPVRGPNREIIGFQSVRFKPDAEEIAAAQDAIQRIQAGDKSLYFSHGRIVKKQPLRRLLLSNRIQASAITLLALAPALSVVMGVPSTTLAWATLLLLPFIIGLIFIRNYRASKTLIDWLGSMLSNGSLKTKRPTQVDTNKELATLSHRIFDFVSAVRATIKGVEDISVKVAQSAFASKQIVNQVYDASLVQSEATTASATAIEEMSHSIAEVYQQTSRTKDMVLNAGTQAQAASKESQAASEQIHHLVDSMETTAGQIEILGQRSEGIEQIVSLIKSIADQTNLLALNAAIEAARAGEHGRGFAVVADEVRGLAERTAKATDEIAEMISAIRNDASKAVSAMHDSKEQANISMDSVNQVAESLAAIRSSMDNSMSMVASIAHAAEEQKSVMSLLAKDIAKISDMAGNNVSTAQQAKEFSEALDVLSNRMQEAARQYQT
jgi:aerotaxis receptor